MGMLINSCKKNDSPSAESLVLGKLARHLCLQSMYCIGERVSERDTIWGVQIQADELYHRVW